MLRALSVTWGGITARSLGANPGHGGNRSGSPARNPSPLRLRPGATYRPRARPLLVGPPVPAGCRSDTT